MRLHKTFMKLSPLFLAVALGSSVAKPAPKKMPTPKVTATQKTDPGSCSNIYIRDNLTGHVLKNEGGDRPIELASLTKIPTVLADILTKAEDTVSYPSPKVADAYKRGIGHYSFCHAPLPGDTHTLSRQNAWAATLATSDNIIAYQIGQAVKQAAGTSTVGSAILTVLKKNGIDVTGLHMPGDDSTGLGNATRCWEGGKKIPNPYKDQGNTATPRAITHLWNVLFDKLGPATALLKEKTYPLHTVDVPNTNPFTNMPGIDVIGKTGTVQDLSAFTGTARNENGQSISFTLVCTNGAARTRIGSSLIREHLARAATPPLATAAKNPDSPKGNTYTASGTNGTALAATFAAP